MRARLEPGTLVADRYRVLTHLGAGAMGDVYAVEHVQLHKTFALKVLAAEGPSLKERFEREARLIAVLDHPNIVRVTDFGESEGVGMFMVMEHVEGVPLGARLAAPMRPAEVIDLAVQILDALAHAHEHAIIHRDLKPDNVLVVDKAGRPTPKILDFGLAKLLPEDSGLTVEGMVFGTPRYMSPEQATGEAVDTRTDLYAVGVILHELVSGAPLFAGQSVQETLRKQVLEAPRPPDAPEPLRGAILRALEKRPEARFPDARAMRDALAPPAVATAPPVAAVPTASTPAAPTPASATSPPRARLVPLALAGVAAVGLATAALVAWLGGPSLDDIEAQIRAGDLAAAKASLAARASDAATPPLVLARAHLAFAEDRPKDAIELYSEAIEAEPPLAGRPLVHEHARRLLTKGHSGGTKLLQLIARSKAAGATPFLVEIAKDGPRPSARRAAFEGLEAQGEVDRLEDVVSYLGAELERVAKAPCEERRWYVDRLIATKEDAIEPLLRRELDRKILIFPASGCMEKDIKAALAALKD